jgi:hypothetical protein
MPSDRLPSRPGSGLPAIPTERGATERGAGEVASPDLAHPARPLNFGGLVVEREDAWLGLSEAVRTRVDARIGELIEWWAQVRDGRTGAAVLGTRSLVTLTPTTRADGTPAQSVRALPLVDGSFRTASVTGATPGSSAAPARPGAGPGRPGSGAARAVSPLLGRIGSDMAGFLGNLPERAQHLLQEPFVSGSGELWSEYYYVREFTGGDRDPATLTIWCYLADRRYVTFAHGIGNGVGDLTGPMTWNLTCWRATVAQSKESGPDGGALDRRS